MRQRLLLHVSFDVPALPVEVLQPLGHGPCLKGRLGQQAFNPYGHIIQASGGIQPGPQNKTQVCAAKVLRLPARDLQQGINTRSGSASTNTCQPGSDQNTVVMVEGYYVGDGTQRHQVKHIAQIRYPNATALEPVPIT